MPDSPIINAIIQSFESLPWYAWLVIGLGLFAKWFGGIFKPNHLLLVAQSHSALKKLNQIGQTQGPAAQFYYLRKRRLRICVGESTSSTDFLIKRFGKRRSVGVIRWFMD